MCFTLFAIGEDVAAADAGFCGELTKLVEAKDGEGLVVGHGDVIEGFEEVIDIGGFFDGDGCGGDGGGG